MKISIENQNNFLNGLIKFKMDDIQRNTESDDEPCSVLEKESVPAEWGKNCNKQYDVL